MLGENAFGNFRDLLEDVSLHPMMGIYLDLARQPEGRRRDRPRARPELRARDHAAVHDRPVRARTPTARTMLDANGKPARAYTGADLDGLAQVFTGFSWYAGPTPATARTALFGSDANLERDWRPMQAYNEYAPKPRSTRSARRPSSARRSRRRPRPTAKAT